MFAVTREQMTALSDMRLRLFEERVINRLREAFPLQVAAQGEQQIIQLIAYSRRHIQKYGFKNDEDIEKYVEVMLLFGRDFDIDPALRWASMILRRRVTPASKIAALHAEAIARWKRKEKETASR